MIAMDTKKLRQKILDLAIRGKLVPQDLNDEPASVLLECIRAEKERLIAEGKIKRPKRAKSSSAESHYQNFDPPFPIPESWTWCILSDCCHIAGRIGFRGYTKDDLVSERNGAITLSPSNIVNGSMQYDTCTYISWNKYHESPEIQVQNNDILLVKTGSSFGKCALVKDLPQEATINPQYVVLKHIMVSPEYLTILLQSRYARNCYERFVLGTAIPTFTQEKLGSLAVPMPPYQEQLRIIQKLHEIQSAIESIIKNKQELESCIKKTKSMILDLAMQGKLVPQDPTDEPASDMLLRINSKAKIITDNPHSWNIPASWCWCQLGDIFHHNTGKALNASNGDGIEYEYITTSNVYWERFELSSLKRMLFKNSEVDKCSVKKGDLLVCEGGDIGRAAIWDLDRSIMIQNHLHRLRPYSKEICTRLYCKILRAYKHNQLIGGKGIALQGFSSNALHKLIVPLIPAEEQIRILDRIESLFAILDRIEISLQS